jgi:hypothetical protein
MTTNFFEFTPQLNVIEVTGPQNTIKVYPTSSGQIGTGFIMPEQFGAVANDVTDDKTAVDLASAAALAVGRPVTVNNQTFYNAVGSVPNGRFEGPNAIRTSDGKRGRYFSAVKSRPTVSSNYGSVVTAFEGDYSGSLFPVEHRITGAATLGQPTTGYLYTPETSPFYVNMFNSSGHNQEVASNVGRTAATVHRVQMTQAGQGDMMAFNFSGSISSSKAGATSFLANPAAVGIAGEIGAGVAGCYLNPMEINCQGNSYDVAAVGGVFNFYRNNATGALGCGWDGIRIQSNGSSPIDTAYRVNGPAQVGLNTVEMTTGDAAIAVRAGQRIYLDSVNPGGTNIFDITKNDTYISVPSLGAEIDFTVNGNPTLQVYDAQAWVAPATASATSFRVYGATSGAVPFASIGVSGTTSFFCAATDGADNTTIAFRTASAGTERDVLSVDSSGAVNITVSGASLTFAGTKVLEARKTGWTAATGTATRTTFVTSTVTTAQLAERVKALLDDLITHGLIGT